jgi:sugar O-acyltransferase (sialic acid O-acetyltransferase NeuD family)
MNEVLFWGGTGQAKVLAEALNSALWRIAAIVDERAIDSPLPAVPMLLGAAGLRGFLASNPAAAQRHFAVAIGGRRGRDRLQVFDLLRSLELAPLTIIHPRAFVARNARLGAGAQVLAMAAICADAILEHAVIVNTGATVDHDCRIGAGAHIGPGAHLAGEVIVGDAAFIGTGAVVLPRLRIGAGSVVGAGAVVTRDVPDNATVTGNPARPMERL